MAEIIPRYEFRAFAQDFGMVETKMRRLAKCEQIRESSEIYIVSAANSENNTKIRDGKMDIKVFVEQREGQEQRNPRMKGEFPMRAEVLRKEVFPAFGVAEPDFRREEYGLQEYLDEIIFPHPQLTAVDVFKLRFAFTVNGCIAEVALIGTYSVNNSLYDMGSCIGFGILGWILKRYGYPPAPVVLGIVLGKLIEYNIRRGVIMGGYSVFYTDTLAFVVLSMATLSLFYPLIRAGWKRLRRSPVDVR
ncbi:MAG: tripartite tricarboxylate transporter permease [Proteobacteria bacterium]|nr:tripartite tricarboxylate transporter permease [Pseudomonadota bacterium]